MAPNGHARLSPSSASRWLRCPGSVNFIDSIEEDDPEGTAAAEGTILHGVMEDCLRSNVEAYEFVGERRVEERSGFELLITEDTADMLQQGLDYIDTLPGRLHIEHWVNLSRWMKGQGGTLDLGFTGKREIIIWDNKFGYLPVSPIENEQLMLYALGFWDNIVRHISNVRRFRLIIWQPRAPGGGGGHLDALAEVQKLIQGDFPLAAATYGEDAPRVPGHRQCLYCPGAQKLRCPEYVNYNLSMVIEDFDDMDDAVENGLPPRLPLNRITPERRTWLLENRASFNKFFDRLHAAAYADAEAGVNTHLMKLVDQREGARRWANAKRAEKELVEHLGEDAYVKKVLSAPQAEVAMKKAKKKEAFLLLEDLIIRPPGKPQLVSASDSRPARKTRHQEAVDEFED